MSTSGKSERLAAGQKAWVEDGMLAGRVNGSSVVRGRSRNQVWGSIVRRAGRRGWEVGRCLVAGGYV